MAGIPSYNLSQKQVHSETYQPLGSTGQGYPYGSLLVAGMVGGAALGTLTVAANTVYALPFVVGVGGIIDSLWANVTTTQASQNYRLGIYSNKKVGVDYPDRLLFDTGSISTGGGGVSTTTCNLPIETNQLYWAVLCSSSTTAAFRSLALGGCYPVLGIDSAMGVALGIGWSLSFTYAALPHIFTAGASVLTTAPPAIGLQINYQAR